MGQSEGDLPGDTTMVAMVASENPLRPFARSLAVRAGRVYMPRHAALFCAVPRRGVPRNVFGVPLEFSALHSSSFTYFAVQRSSGNRSNSAISARFPLSSSPANSIFFSLPSFGFASSHSIFLSLFLSPFLSVSLSLSFSSNFSFSLPRRNSRFPALSKINTSQRGLKTCVNMVLHCLYVHITLSAPGYYHHTEPRRPLRRPFRLFIPRWYR